MKTLACAEPGQLVWQQQAMPQLQPGHAIIKIKRIGICGTDLHAWEGTQPYFTYPRVLGHELAATLVAADGAPGFKEGENVTIIPYFNCGTCIACRRGKPNCCVFIKVCGVHVDGGMTEYLQVPSNALVHAGGLSLDELALVEPLAIGAHGVSRAAVEQGETVLVMGAGPIGLGTMELARIAGARVIALDLSADRLLFCGTQLGITDTINPRDGDAAAQLRELTGGDMATVVIDATGNLAAINSGIQYLAHGGRYVLIGLQKEAFSFSHPEFHKRESTLMSSRNATRQDFERVMRAMQEAKLDPATYITHRVAFEEVPTAFAGWLKPENKVIKAMVELG